MPSVPKMKNTHSPKYNPHASCSDPVRQAWSRAQVKSYYGKVFDSMSCSAELSDWMENTLEGISDPSLRQRMRKALLIENHRIKEKCRNADPDSDRRKEHLKARVGQIERCWSRSQQIASNPKALLGQEGYPTMDMVESAIKQKDHLIEADLLPEDYSFYDCDFRPVEKSAIPAASGLSPEASAVTGAGLFSAIGAMSQLPYVAAAFASVPILYLGYKAWSYCSKHEKTD